MTDQPPRPRHAPPASPVVQRAQLRDAFVHLHADRLHGFALLLTLGDRRRAAELATEAIDAGSKRVETLRHPERAAAWLRARVVRRSGRIRRDGADPASVAALVDLGVSGATWHALASIGPRERAALVAAGVEGFATADIEEIVGRRGSRLADLLRRARDRYAIAFAAAADAGDEQENGPLTDQVLAVAARALG